jgi:hypothetical protein
MFPRYDARFFGGRDHGEGKGEVEAADRGVVEGRCADA